MNFFLKLLLVLILFHKPAFGSLRPYTTLHPIKVEQFNSNSKTITFWLPCGTNFEGLFVSRGKKTVKVGAVALALSANCLKMPQKYTLRFRDYFKHKLEVKSITPAWEPMRLSRVEADNVTVSKRYISLRYTRKCIAIIGTVITPMTDKSVKVSMLGTKRHNSGCSQSSETSVSIPNNLPSRYTKVYSRSDTAQYTLHLASILPNSLTTEGDNLSLKFSKACNEVGLGVAKTQHGYAVLIARYKEDSCYLGAPKTWSKLKDKNLFNITSNSRLVSTKLSEWSIFSISPPKTIKRSKNLIKISSYPDCRRTLGIVLTQINQHIRIATLQTARYTKCNGISTIRTFSVKTNLRDNHRVLPLRLRF